MKPFNAFTLALFLASTLGASAAWAKDGILNSVKAGESNYCHMHFPAIDESTLSSTNPRLQDPGSGDIIHFYGACDYDPHGRDAVQAQKRDQQRRFVREYES
jgi:hypothetical protein